MAAIPNDPTDEQVDERFEELRRREFGESDDQMVRVRVIRKQGY